MLFPERDFLFTKFIHSVKHHLEGFSSCPRWKVTYMKATHSLLSRNIRLRVSLWLSGLRTRVTAAVVQVTAVCGFDPWPGNLCVPWAKPNKQNKAITVLDPGPGCLLWTGFLAMRWSQADPPPLAVVTETPHSFQ